MNRRDVFRLGVAVLAAAAALATLWGVLDVWTSGVDAPQIPVGEHLEESGVDHPVTAVLLNFRAYDTLLEIAVLTAAFWGGWSLRVWRESALTPPPDVMLRRVAAQLIPVLLLVVVYLLWAGAHRPGGEFQAGAVLGATGILMLLVGRAIPGAHRMVVRHLLAVGGVAVFIAVGLAGRALSGDVLGYRTGWEKSSMLLIEVAAAVSVGFVLAALFAGSVQQLTGNRKTTPVASGDYSGGNEVEYRDYDSAAEILEDGHPEGGDGD